MFSDHANDRDDDVCHNMGRGARGSRSGCWQVEPAPALFHRLAPAAAHRAAQIPQSCAGRNTGRGGSAAVNRSVDGRPGGELEDFTPTWSDHVTAPRRLVGWEGSEFYPWVVAVWSKLSCWLQSWALSANQPQSHCPLPQGLDWLCPIIVVPRDLLLMGFAWDSSLVCDEKITILKCQQPVAHLSVWLHL